MICDSGFFMLRNSTQAMKSSTSFLPVFNGYAKRKQFVWGLVLFCFQKRHFSILQSQPGFDSATHDESQSGFRSFLNSYVRQKWEVKNGFSIVRNKKKEKKTSHLALVLQSALNRRHAGLEQCFFFPGLPETNHQAGQASYGQL